MILFIDLCLFFIGASFGSFINMAAYRIPKSLSLVRPRSYCNDCKNPLPFLALIPVLGYFLTAGKCSRCKMKIPLEYPLVEMLCGAFFVFAAYYYDILFSLAFAPAGLLKSDSFLQFITLLWLFSSGLLLSIIDFKHHILPDVIVIPGIFVNLVLGSLNPELGFEQSILGIAVGGGGLFLISKLYEIIRKREGMGFGDVKYLAFLGAVLGWQGVLVTLFLASVLGSVIGVLFLLFQRKSLHTPIPFGPFLALGGIICFAFMRNFLYFHT